MHPTHTITANTYPTYDRIRVFVRTMCVCACTHFSINMSKNMGRLTMSLIRFLIEAPSIVILYFSENEHEKKERERRIYLWIYSFSFFLFNSSDCHTIVSIDWQQRQRTLQWNEQQLTLTIRILSVFCMHRDNNNFPIHCQFIWGLLSTEWKRLHFRSDLNWLNIFNVVVALVTLCLLELNLCTWNVHLYKNDK